MAYMSQEMKKELAPAIKKVLKEYGVKGTIGVSNYSTLVVNIKSGPFSFTYNEQGDNVADKGYLQVNQYYINENFKDDEAEFLSKLKDAMMVGNFDKSDSQTDYYHVGWYININIGKWNKPYEQEAA